MDFIIKPSVVNSQPIPAGAGGVIGFEDYGGIAGGSDYNKSYQTSMLARFAPDTLAASVRRSWDEPFLEEITPAKPKAVSMVGSDVFGPPSFHSTTRNSMLDLRGEAALGVSNYSSSSSHVPDGASVVSWAGFANPNYPASTGLACGTCNADFSGASPVAKPMMRPRYESSANGKNKLASALKSAFLL